MARTRYVGRDETLGKYAEVVGMSIIVLLVIILLVILIIRAL